MAWREEIMLGTAYVESLYLGAYPGTLMNTTNLYVTALGATTINAGVDADGTKGQIILWPDTTAKGQILIQAADNTGDDIITLTNGNTSGNITVTLPTQTGTILVDGQATINVGADSGGVLGTINLWPDTADKGKLVITCADNAGDDVVTVTGPASTAGDITITLPDVTSTLAYNGQPTMNIGADSGGVLGTLVLWPDTADKGSMQIICADNAGDDVYTLTTPASTAAAVTATLPDVTGYLVAGTAQITLAEADILDGATVTTAELNRLDGGWASITTVSETGASGSVAVQLQFKDAAGVNMAVPVSGQFFLADEATGLTHATVDTSVATLTNGSVAESGAGHNVISFVTAADGTLGFTITAAGADSYWAVFAGPGGLSHITDELIVDA